MVAAAGTGRAGWFTILDVGGALLVFRATDFPDVSPFEATQMISPNPNRHADDPGDDDTAAVIVARKQHRLESHSGRCPDVPIQLVQT